MLTKNTANLLFIDVDGILARKGMSEEDNEEKAKQRKAISRYYICCLLT